jgi:RES domain
MSKGRRPAKRPPIVRGAGRPETLLQLESFSSADIDRWNVVSSKLDELHEVMYFELERHRLAHREALLTALRSRPGVPLVFDPWYRVVEYRYCLEPLSTTGSVQRIGGRFNFGKEIREGYFESFPALYVAETVETAYREFYQLKDKTRAGGLSSGDLALRRPGGFLIAEIKGQLGLVFNAGDLKALAPFAAVIREFPVPRRAMQIVRELKLQKRPLIQTANDVRRQLLLPTWRELPRQFDLPANSQIFGRLVRDAGYEAILYPSSKNAARCIGVFPENLRESDSFLELSGGYPEEVQVRRLDSSTVPVP